MAPNNGRGSRRGVLPPLHALVVVAVVPLILLPLLLLRAVDALAAGAGNGRPVDFLALTDDSTGWAEPPGRRGQEEAAAAEEEASSSSSLLSLSSSSWLDTAPSSSSGVAPRRRGGRGSGREGRDEDGADRAGGDGGMDEEEDEEEEEEASLEALLSAPALEDRKAESPWVARFCNAPAHGRFFCRVPASFIAEEFNWLDLPCPPDLEAIDLLLLGRPQPGPVLGPGPGLGPPHEGSYVAFAGGMGGGGGSGEALQAAARRMYGLIHARYIVTQKGLNAMRAKFEAAHFGTCPRLGCGGQAVLPVGLREDPRPPEQEREREREGLGDGATGEEADEHGLKLFCPRCRELYHPGPAGAALDGAYWGTTFAHLFLLAFPELDLARQMPAPGAGPGAGAAEAAASVAAMQERGEQLVPAGARDKGKAPAYVPRVFGFRVGRPPKSLAPPADEPVVDEGPAAAPDAPAPAPAPPPAPAPILTSPVATPAEEAGTTTPAHDSIMSVATRSQSRGLPIGPGSALSFPSICTTRRRSRDSSGPGGVVRAAGRAVRDWLHRMVQRVRRQKHY